MIKLVMKVKDKHSELVVWNFEVGRVLLEISRKEQLNNLNGGKKEKLLF